MLPMPKMVCLLTPSPERARQHLIEFRGTRARAYCSPKVTVLGRLLETGVSLTETLTCEKCNRRRLVLIAFWQTKLEDEE